MCIPWLIATDYSIIIPPTARRRRRPTDRSIYRSIQFKWIYTLSFHARNTVSERQRDLVRFLNRLSQITISNRMQHRAKMIYLEISLGLPVSRKPDFWHEKRVSEFTLIESIDKSIDPELTPYLSLSASRSRLNFVMCSCICAIKSTEDSRVDLILPCNAVVSCPTAVNIVFISS